MEREYNREIAQRVIEALKGVKLSFTFDSDAGIVKLSMGQVGPFRKVDVYVEARSNDIITYAFFPLNADGDDPARMADMAEFITRANYGLCNGCFEMDYRDGEIRFKSYIDCEDLIPCDKVILNSIFTSVTMIRRYTPGFAGIIFYGESPEAMVMKCESDLHTGEEDVTGLFNRLLEENGGVPDGPEKEVKKNGGSGDDGDDADTWEADDGLYGDEDGRDDDEDNGPGDGEDGPF